MKKEERMNDDMEKHNVRKIFNERRRKNVLEIISKNKYFLKNTKI